MAVYMISYDLNAPGKNYENLIAAIKSFSNWAHPLKSQWLVVSDPNSSIAIRDYLRPHIDTNDQLLVTEVPLQMWAASNLAQEIVDWLQAYM